MPVQRDELAADRATHILGCGSLLFVFVIFGIAMAAEPSTVRSVPLTEDAEETFPAPYGERGNYYSTDEIRIDGPNGDELQDIYFYYDDEQGVAVGAASRYARSLPSDILSEMRSKAHQIRGPPDAIIRSANPHVVIGRASGNSVQSVNVTRMQLPEVRPTIPRAPPIRALLFVR